MSKPKRYPEHEKMAAVKRESQEIGDFLEWLNSEEKYAVGEWMGERFVPARATIETLLASYFRINLDKIEQEKRKMLAEIRRTA